MHPSVSINSLSIQAGSLAAHVDTVARLGAAAISPTLEEVDALGAAAADRLLRDAGLRVATFTHRAFGFADAEAAATQRERLHRTIDLAARIGAQSVTLTTGGRGTLTFGEAVDRFTAAIAPCAEHARSSGVALAIEPTSHLYADVSIAHRLHDLAEIAARAGIALGIDLFACWFDADIDDAIVQAVPRCRIVQVSDYVAGDRGLPCRAVPADGMAQVERLVTLILAAGYRGDFDLELIGPRIEREGASAALARAGARLGAWIDAAIPSSSDPDRLAGAAIFGEPFRA